MNKRSGTFRQELPEKSDKEKTERSGTISLAMVTMEGTIIPENEYASMRAMPL